MVERHDDDALIDAAVEAADLRTLAVCLFHWTGERRWLDEPFRPRRDVRLIADRSGGFEPDVQEQIKDAARMWLRSSDRVVAIDDPGPELFHEMMSTFLGEVVPPEYLDLVRIEMGYEDGDAHWSAEAGVDEPPDVVVVGAGVSGLCLAHKLDQLSIPMTVVEKNPAVGGTWFENRYPGCGVDTPNHFYSYSFAPNPGWRHYFSSRDELHDYLERCADDFVLRERLRLATRVRSAEWNEQARRWSIEIEGPDGDVEVLTPRVFVAATGHFNNPTPVHFDGQDDFGGEILHTARWPQDVDLAGRRVAVIGTGASSMQLVPTIADEVAALRVFQRSPQWVRPIPEYGRPVDPAAQWLFENLPHYAKWYRFGEFWRYGDGLLRHLRIDPEWEHPERSLNRTNDKHRREMTEYICAELADRPDLVEHCVPSYPPFGKRILLDNGWFSTLCRDHVELVTSSIEHIESGGIRTADGRMHEADVIVLATGFTITDLVGKIEVRGRAGRRLADDWADDDPTAYLGMAVPGFPNFFVMYGPNTNMGHGGSGIFLAEAQARYISGMIVEMAERDVAVDCREDRRAAYTDEIDRLHEDLIWSHRGMTTYYRNPSGRVRSPMPFRLVEYFERTRSPDLGDYELTSLR